MDITTTPITLFGQEYLVYKGACCSEHSDKRTLYVELTDTCNAKCPFCSAGRGSTTGSHMVSPDTLKKCVDELVGAGAIDRVSITGGEPLIVQYTELGRLLDILDNSGVDFYAITTNGRYLAKNLYLLKGHARLRYLNVSRHHFDDAENRKIFGDENIPGIADVASMFRILDEGGRNFRLNCTLGPGVDMGWIRRYIEAAAHNEISSVLFRHDYFEPHHMEIYKIFNELLEGRKESTKCRCMYGYVDWADMQVEYREVNAGLEHKYEREQQYIRNFVLHADGSLTGGWSDDSIKIKREW